MQNSNIESSNGRNTWQNMQEGGNGEPLDIRHLGISNGLVGDEPFLWKVSSNPSLEDSCHILFASPILYLSVFQVRIQTCALILAGIKLFNWLINLGSSSRKAPQWGSMKTVLLPG